MKKDPETDDFELTNEQLEHASAAILNSGYKRGSVNSNNFLLNRFKYLKALEDRAGKLFNLVLLALKSDHGKSKVSNNKF